MDFELTGNETDAELEAMLDKLGDVAVVEGDAEPAKPVEVEKKEPETKAEPEKEKVEDKATTASETDKAKTRDESGKFISSKNDDGKKIPYAVLEAARAEARRNREEAEANAAKYDEANRMLEVLKRQLDTAGVKPGDLPERTTIDPEKLKALRDDFPELAELMENMSGQIEYLKSKAAPPAKAESGADSNPVVVAMKNVPELVEWRDNDQDRFSLAISIDENLQKDAAWTGKSLTERFQEVSRRVKAAYGEEPAPARTEQTTDDLKKQADQALQKAKADAEIPASPSDIGQANSTSEKSAVQKAAEASQADLLTQMAGMSDAEIEKLLSQTF